MEKLVGRITHFFPKIGVAVVELLEDVSQGDEVQISGGCTNFRQIVSSMQSEHNNVEHAHKGMSVGMKVDQEVKKGDNVYKLS